MTAALDPPVRIGATTVAALTEQAAGLFRLRSSLAGHGTKRPVAVLIHHRGETTAFEVDGRPIDLGEFDRRYPDHRSAFDEIARRRPGADGAR